MVNKNVEGIIKDVQVLDISIVGDIKGRGQRVEGGVSFVFGIMVGFCIRG